MLLRPSPRQSDGDGDGALSQAAGLPKIARAALYWSMVSARGCHADCRVAPEWSLEVAESGP